MPARAPAPRRPRVWEREVEDFIRTQLSSWAFDPYAQDGDPRLLLVVTTEAGELVGVGAHERVMLHDAASGERLAATRIEVVAVATAWQGHRLITGETAGPRVSDVLMSAIMADVVARVPPRDARVLTVVHQDNARSLALCHRYGLTQELTRPHPRTAADHGSRGRPSRWMRGTVPAGSRQGTR